MKRALLTCLSAAAVALATPASLTPSAAGAPVPGPLDARARLVSCHRDVSLVRRSLTVESVMRSLREGDRLEARFELFQRRPGALLYRRLSGQGLNTWLPASPGTDLYRVRKPIQGLPAPASYFVRVRYRWLDGGVVYARATRTTRVCYQPDMRPNLRFGLVTFAAVPGTERARYSVVVRNDGRSAAGPFDLVLSVNGKRQPAAQVAGLPAGGREVVEIVGPRCRGGTLALALDTANAIDESGERDNMRLVACTTG